MVEISGSLGTTAIMAILHLGQHSPFGVSFNSPSAHSTIRHRAKPQSCTHLGQHSPSGVSNRSPAAQVVGERQVTAAQSGDDGGSSITGTGSEKGGRVGPAPPIGATLSQYASPCLKQCRFVHTEICPSSVQPQELQPSYHASQLREHLPSGRHASGQQFFPGHAAGSETKGANPEGHTTGVQPSGPSAGRGGVWVVGGFGVVSSPISPLLLVHLGSPSCSWQSIFVHPETLPSSQEQ
mmetsp:Transcript_38556/g.75719  ORF Transcript_38556/g.75719 Transcript_38556/m.75719 type:complete len:238 (+) Transcript_38556:921-1634(+)